MVLYCDLWVLQSRGTVTTRVISGRTVLFHMSDMGAITFLPTSWDPGLFGLGSYLATLENLFLDLPTLFSPAGVCGRQTDVYLIKLRDFVSDTTRTKIDLRTMDT